MVCTILLCGILLAGRYDDAPPGSDTSDLSVGEQEHLQEVVAESLEEAVKAGPRAILEFYYAPYPETVEGWATRFGDDGWAVDELWFSAREAADQYRLASYSLTGGGYGYQEIGGTEYLLTNRASDGFEALAVGGIEWDGPVTPEQRRLYRMAAMDREAFLEFISREYVGVIFTKSPNDIGRTFCLSRQNGTQIGPVIVGNVSALDDYTPLAGRQDPLGLQTAKGQHWIADLPNSLYYASGGEGGPAYIRLAGGDCDTVHNPPPSRFVCPVESCEIENVTQQMSVEHPAVDLRTGINGPIYSPGDGFVHFVGDLRDGCGHAVMLDLGGDWRATLCHLGEIDVGAGQPVRAGQLLGYTGDSGNITGQHAHVEITENGKTRNLLALIDPSEVIGEQPVRSWQGYWQ